MRDLTDLAICLRACDECSGTSDPTTWATCHQTDTDDITNVIDYDSIENNPGI